VGGRSWLADTPGFPDANPCAFVDPRGKLWLLWPVILANECTRPLLQYKVTSDAPRNGRAPLGRGEDAASCGRAPSFPRRSSGCCRNSSPRCRRTSRARAEGWARRDPGQSAREKLSTRLGWMPRVHPIVLDARRILVPLYSDGLSTCP
jgi:hypothetical protein